jgi:hypothetical protein
MSKNSGADYARFGSIKQSIGAIGESSVSRL